MSNSHNSVAPCDHPLSRRVQTWKCADCNKEMPNTPRDVLGDPREAFVVGQNLCVHGYYGGCAACGGR